MFVCVATRLFGLTMFMRIEAVTPTIYSHLFVKPVLFAITNSIMYERNTNLQKSTQIQGGKKLILVRTHNY